MTVPASVLDAWDLSLLFVVPVRWCGAVPASGEPSTARPRPSSSHPWRRDTRAASRILARHRLILFFIPNGTWRLSAPPDSRPAARRQHRWLEQVSSLLGRGVRRLAVRGYAQRIGYAASVAD